MVKHTQKSSNQIKSSCCRRIVWVCLTSLWGGRLKGYVDLNFPLRTPTCEGFHSLLSNLLLINPLSANPTKWANTIKQFVGKLPTICLSVSDHFVGLALKGLKSHDEIFNILSIKILKFPENVFLSDKLKNVFPA